MCSGGCSAAQPTAATNTACNCSRLSSYLNGWLHHQFLLWVQYWLVDLYCLHMYLAYCMGLDIMCVRFCHVWFCLWQSLYLKPSPMSYHQSEIGSYVILMMIYVAISTSTIKGSDATVHQRIANDWGPHRPQVNQWATDQRKHPMKQHPPWVS